MSERESNLKRAGAFPAEPSVGPRAPVAAVPLWRLALAAPVFILLAFPAFGVQSRMNVEEIVKRSIAATRADLQAEPEFSWRERDVITGGKTTSNKTYRVIMLDGSPYRRLVGIKDEPLSSARAEQESRKLKKEIARRANESPQERAERIARYERDRKRELALMSEMTDAFQFQLVGEKELDGREVYDLRAAPRPGYEPRSRETKVLTGMRGELYIDTRTCQWVRVEAEAFKPVWFGWFIAKVNPGTSFLLEQAPVAGEVWLPRHFRVVVKSAILWWQRNSIDDETYTDYQPTVRR